MAGAASHLVVDIGEAIGAGAVDIRRTDRERDYCKEPLDMI